ncbi:ATP-binding protein [Halovenus rubra]|uniref:ATP-binding protein n=2 Tax=Halovenus rubra TaxID=869890 RepID=A0ABD5X769_9EURY|nr:hybrid sensor histidine kinase/response regulator [Halovenus rubra]
MSGSPSHNLSVADVLLVEDNDDDALFVRRDLEQGVEYAFVDEIELTRANSLAEAIDICSGSNFDAVFLDLGLPDSNGTETVDRFAEEGFDVPVIILTGLQDNEVALEAIQSGAQDYLVKSDTTPKTIVRTMRHAIERKRNERQVRRQRDQMEFFNNILRHDLLNGMEVIQVHSRMLADDLEGEHGENAETVLNWSENIVDLTQKVRNVLDTLTEEETPDIHKVVVADIVTELVDEAEAMRNGVSVSIDCASDIQVLADDLLLDVLRNLLVNAVEHTKPDPVSVEIAAERQGDTVEIVVADDGPGIPKERKEAIFNRGESGESSSGTGFGLFFVDLMVDTYGGAVHVEDNDPEGARFVLELDAA